MPNISPGMKVVGIEGNDVGWVKDVRGGNFVLDKPKAPDLLVPLTECMRVEGDIVWLRVESTQVHKQGWQQAAVPDEAGVPDKSGLASGGAAGRESQAAPE